MSVSIPVCLEELLQTLAEVCHCKLSYFLCQHDWLAAAKGNSFAEGVQYNAVWHWLMTRRINLTTSDGAKTVWYPSLASSAPYSAWAISHAQY